VVKKGSRGAQVTGIDISPDLLALARSRDTEKRCKFIEADAASYPFAQPYDALFSRFGIMFFDDPVAALAHLRSALRPGAPLVAVVWAEARDNAWASIPLKAARPFVGEERSQPTPSGTPGPFAWAKVSTGPDLLKAAGWRNIESQRVERLVPLGPEDTQDPAESAADFCLRIGPMASRLNGLEESVIRQVREALTDAFRPMIADGRLRFQSAAWIIRASA
jgi:SAM-dependent methyltransferase